jgi:hypothetical protein
MPLNTIAEIVSTLSQELEEKAMAAASVVAIAFSSCLKQLPLKCKKSPDIFAFSSPLTY